MYSSGIQGKLPKHRRTRDMSHMFGPHMCNGPSGPIYFGGDAFIVECPPDKIPLEQTPPPTWLIADWILAHKREEPLSQIAQYYVEHTEHWPEALHWLSKTF